MQTTKQINLKKIEKATTTQTFGLTIGFGLTDFVELISLDSQTMATNFWLTQPACFATLPPACVNS
jgi:hypothetical protein